MDSGIDVIRHSENVMGTVVSFAVVPGNSPARAAAAAVESACAVLHEADRTFSTWDPQSPVSRLRRGAASLSDLPAEVAGVLEFCESARKASAGWFDPWAIEGGVDPTGLVKGWAVDQAVAVLREAGMDAAMVNGGGDVAVFGVPAPGQGWRIGIRHPWRAGSLAAIVVATGAVATSGSYERGSHLLNPFTGDLASKAASATVTGPSLALADALATALAVGGDEVLAIVAGLDGYAGYLIRPDGTEADTGNVAFAS
ncbi:MAG TPA: thiamine biosynthesis protein [Actinobacteria bacterium]|jgi:thiamine biosynthesis lipoprotein|nr:thiamine biosynthesis protein [Actinomycetota bacterium]